MGRLIRTRTSTTRLVGASAWPDGRLIMGKYTKHLMPPVSATRQQNNHRKNALAQSTRKRLAQTKVQLKLMEAKMRRLEKAKGHESYEARVAKFDAKKTEKTVHEIQKALLRIRLETLQKAFQEKTHKYGKKSHLYDGLRRELHDCNFRVIELDELIQRDEKELEIIVAQIESFVSLAFTIMF